MKIYVSKISCIRERIILISFSFYSLFFFSSFS